MVSLLIGSAGRAVEPVLIYLAIPAVVAGITYGRLATTNTSLASVLTLVAAVAAGQPPARGISVRERRPPVAGYRPWRRPVGGHADPVNAPTGGRPGSVRRRAPARWPVAQPRARTADGPGRLHPCPRHPGTGPQHQRRGPFSNPDPRGEGALEPVGTHGTLVPADEETAHACIDSGRIQRQASTVAVPLRVGDQVFGALLLEGPRPFVNAKLAAVQEQVDEHAIRLETALLIDDVRSLATAEERNRLARDIHDGVAQRIVSLGYLADDIAARSSDTAARRGAEEMRDRHHQAHQ